MKRPSSSPWGKIQTCRSVADGVFQVNTAGHGGFLVHHNLLSRLSSYAKEFGGEAYGSGEYMAFEEDCAWAFVVLELGVCEDKRKYALDSVVHWFPEYALNENIDQLLNSEQRERRTKRLEEKDIERQEAKLREEKSPNLVVAGRFLENKSDWEFGFKITTDCPVTLLHELQKQGEVFDPEQILEHFNDGKLTQVWTADGRIHIVENYTGRQRNKILFLSECGRIIFSQK